MDALHDLMELIPSDSGVCRLIIKAFGFNHYCQLYETARETKDALRAACDVSSYWGMFFVADFLHRVVYANR